MVCQRFRFIAIYRYTGQSPEQTCNRRQDQELGVSTFKSDQHSNEDIAQHDNADSV
jgi:hypothetical protein